MLAFEVDCVLGWYNIGDFRFFSRFGGALSGVLFVGHAGFDFLCWVCVYCVFRDG